MGENPSPSIRGCRKATFDFCTGWRCDILQTQDYETRRALRRRRTRWWKKLVKRSQRWVGEAWPWKSPPESLSRTSPVA